MSAAALGLIALAACAESLTGLHVALSDRTEQSVRSASTASQLAFAGPAARHTAAGPLRVRRYGEVAHIASSQYTAEAHLAEFVTEFAVARNESLATHPVSARAPPVI